MLCRECGEQLESVRVGTAAGQAITGWQHIKLPEAGMDRGHDPQPVPAAELSLWDRVDALTSRLGMLRQLSPADRDRAARDLREQTAKILYEVRRDAATEAVEGGMSQAAYGRLIGVAPATVADLLAGRVRPTSARRR